MLSNRRFLLGAIVLLVFIWTGAHFHQRIVPEHLRPWDRLGSHGSSSGSGSSSSSSNSKDKTDAPTPSAEQNIPAASAKDNFEFSIKPIAYVFPQFHPIPENDKNWGVNFTEWDNVKKVTHNNFGLETLRPTEEVGYYNLLDYNVRARYGQQIRDMGFYGIAYHHYWFSHPTMEKVPQAILADGQPDVPFLLSWANEPWKVTWEGQEQNKLLQAQEYGGLADWREHFDWLLPFFQHPLYIRVNGKPQFMIYKPRSLGETGIHMFAAFRRWAVEAGLPGLDIIETRGQPESGNNRGLSDAMSEFLWQSYGIDGAGWAQNNRVSNVYHRGVTVTWDNTPRYGMRGSVNIFAHPSLWKNQVLEVIRRMKLEPNPRGEENFLFVNALNEWGEGNVLEPSMQWGDSYLRAARTLMDDEKTQLRWRDDIIDAGLKMAADTQKAADAGTPVDVCVVVPMRTCTPRFSEPNTAAELFDSLIAQTNPHWRAVAFRASPQAAAGRAGVCEKLVLDTFDPRIVYAGDSALPDDVLQQDAFGARSLFSTQHILSHLDEISPACAGARYLLVASEDATYDPAALDLDLVQTNGTAAMTMSGSSPDIVGLHYMTPRTLATALGSSATPAAWDRHCARLNDDSESEDVDLCAAAQPDTHAADLLLGATLLNLPKLKPLLLSENLFAAANASSTPDHAILDKLHREAGWSWAASTHSRTKSKTKTKTTCDLVGARTYKSCARTGRIWLDMPSSQTTYASECLSLNSITKQHGWLLDQWDMEAWRANPFCLRLSQARYGELFAAAAASDAGQS